MGCDSSGNGAKRLHSLTLTVGKNHELLTLSVPGAVLVGSPLARWGSRGFDIRLQSSGRVSAHSTPRRTPSDLVHSRRSRLCRVAVHARGTPSAATLNPCPWIRRPAGHGQLAAAVPVLDRDTRFTEASRLDHFLRPSAHAALLCRAGQADAQEGRPSPRPNNGPPSNWTVSRVPTFPVR